MIARYSPDPNDITASGGRQTDLHQEARAARHAKFGRSVFVRGVIEVSNYCRENCAYCGMRRDNTSLPRYRAEPDRLLEALLPVLPSFITDLNLQAGEDPVAVRSVVLPLLKALRRETRLGLSLCLGTLAPDLYQELMDAGARIYIMKFETGIEADYARVLAPGTLPERINHIRMLAGSGWNVTSGFIAGLPGQGIESLLTSLELCRNLPLKGCSVSPFIPGGQTPLAEAPPASLEQTLNCMAMLRCMRPDWTIPAVSALHLTGEDGYRRGLRAGANLITLNLTPDQYRGEYVIYKKDRFIMTAERALAAMESEGLEPSRQSLESYYEGTPPQSREQAVQTSGTSTAV